MPLAVDVAHGGRLRLDEAPQIVDGATADLIAGLGREVQIRYLPLTDHKAYTRFHNSATVQWGRGSAVYDIVTPHYVVSRVQTNAPTFEQPDGTRILHYHYAGARIQAGGRGFLGFAETVMWDPQLGLRTHALYRQDHPFTGLLVEKAQVLATEASRFGLLR